MLPSLHPLPDKEKAHSDQPSFSLQYCGVSKKSRQKEGQVRRKVFLFLEYETISQGENIRVCMDKLKANGLCKENKLEFELKSMFCSCFLFFYQKSSLVPKDIDFLIFLTLLISTVLLARDASWESLGLGYFGNSYTDMLIQSGISLCSL